MRLFTLLCIVALVICSCDENGVTPTTTNENVDKGTYRLVITGDGIADSLVLVGETVKTNWDPGAGFIFLNTDENIEPLGTLTMTIAVPLIDASTWLDRWGYVPVYDALVSKTEVRVGTAVELNGRTYQKFDGDDKGFTNMEIGTNFISGNIEFTMERILVWQQDEPETVTVKGWFVAKST